jgi:hypothetical protein
MAYEPVARDQFLDGIHRFRQFFYDDGMVGFGAMSEEPFLYIFVDEHKIVTVRAEPSLKDRIERLLKAFDLDACEDARRGAVLQAEPLAAVGRHVARERRVGRDEHGGRQERRPVGRQTDQVVAVGTEAVEEHDQTVGGAAGGGADARAVQSEEGRHGATLGGGAPSCQGAGRASGSLAPLGIH